MGSTLRLISGIYLLLSTCQLLQCTDIKQQIDQNSEIIIKEEILANNGTKNQTINGKSEPKTDQTILSNNIYNVVKNDEQIQKIDENNNNNNNNNSETINLATTIDIKKYVSKDFHDRNNVYTFPSSSSSDIEKFINNNHDYQTTTYKSPDYTNDFSFNTQLTTPKSRIFDKNYKETVDSVDQTLEHIDNEQLTSNLQSEQHTDVNLDQLYEKTTKNNDSNSNLEYKSIKNIIKNTTNDRKSIKNDLIIEENTKLNFNSNYNQTRLIGDDGEKPKENVRIQKNHHETTTIKTIILTKPPSTRNNSHISILNNKIETETLKAIDSNLATTEIVKTNEPSVQENQIIPIRVEAPFNNNKTDTTTTEIVNNENVEIVTQFSTIPIDITTELATTEIELTTTEISTRKREDTETTTEIVTTIDSTISTTEMTTIAITDDPITTTETNWRTSKGITFDDDETTTETTKNGQDEITTKIVSTETENVEITTTESTTANTETESSIEVTEYVTTESPTTEINDEAKQTTKLEDFSQKPEIKSVTTELPTTVLNDSFNKITKHEHSITETEETRRTEIVDTRTELPIAETTETSSNNAVNRLPKLDDHFRKQSNTTTEITTIMETQTDQDSTDSSDNMPPTSDSSEIVADSDGDNDSGKVIAIVISSIGAICLILLAGLLFIMRKRQKRFNYGQRCRPVNLDDYSMDNVSVYNSVRRKAIDRSSKRSYGNPAFEDPTSISHPLNFPALGKFANNFDDMKAEFEEIPQITAKTNELPDGCDTKNRYANVIPLPETRVFLNFKDGSPTSDYINANYVTGPKNAKGYYIACQAPLQNTVDDFWRMIWEQQCKVILMLTHLFENGVEKCFDYLPPSEVLDCHRLFGDYQVTLKKREVKDKYIISILQLKNMVSNSWREITHFWYLGWPDKGVPFEANSLIAFLIEARSYMKTSSIDRELSNGGLINGKTTNDINPVVVHCSPGTGRTGVVIACDIAIREFEQNRLVDIPRIVYKIRRDRASAVQTKEQYMFIYKVISLYATKLTGGALDSL